jgi:hypothetical protein
MDDDTFGTLFIFFALLALFSFLLLVIVSSPPIYDWTWLAVSTIALGEIIFWLCAEQPEKGKNIFEWTAGEKMMSYLIALLISMPINAAGYVIYRFPKEVSTFFMEIVPLAFWVLAFLGIAFFIVLVNSLKFRFKKPKNKKKKGGGKK